MFTGADDAFIAETLAQTPQEQERLRARLRHSAELRERLLEDPRLVQRLRADEEQVVKISPRLLFDLLLRQVRRDLRHQRYTLERLSGTERVPVFDARAAGDILDDRDLHEYLVAMLASFVRIEHITVLQEHAGRVVHRRLSTLNIDDLAELASLLAEADRFPLYRRIADVALFLSGVFADAIRKGAPPVTRPPGLGPPPRRLRGLQEYEEEGRRFYRLAAGHATAHQLRLDRVLELLAEEFPLVRKPLAVMADRYMTWTRLRLFDGPTLA